MWLQLGFLWKSPALSLYLRGCGDFVIFEKGVLILILGWRRTLVGGLMKEEGGFGMEEMGWDGVKGWEWRKWFGNGLVQAELEIDTNGNIVTSRRRSAKK